MVKDIINKNEKQTRDWKTIFTSLMLTVLYLLLIHKKTPINIKDKQSNKKQAKDINRQHTEGDT